MTLDDLGNIGEFVGAIAVVITLGYLAFQIRQNTRTARSATHQAWVSAAAQINLVVLQNRDIARVWRSGSEDPGQLDPEELLQFNAYVLQMFRAFEALYLMFLNGAVDATYWNSQVQSCRAVMTPSGVQSWWARYSETFLDPRFREFVQREVLREPVA